MSILNEPSIHLSKNAKDLSGQKFGELTAIKPIGRQGPNLVWACSCLCGGEKAVIAAHLNRGSVKSCGCLVALPVQSTFIGPKQPRINKGKLTDEEKRQRGADRKRLRAEHKKAKRLSTATANAAARIRAAEASMILTDEELWELCQLPVEEQATAITRATAKKLNDEKTSSYAHKLASEPKFRQKEMEKQERRYQKALDRREAEKEAIVVRKAEAAQERIQHASQHLSSYLLVADTEARTLYDWFNTDFGLYRIPELKEIHAVWQSLYEEGPGYAQWQERWFSYLSSGEQKPEKPAWLAALWELYYTQLTVPEHCEWLNDFNYKEYEYEQEATTGGRIAYAETA